MREPNLCTSELFSLGESDKKGFFFVNILGTASNLLSLARASWELGCAESAKLFPVCLLACTDGGSPWWGRDLWLTHGDSFLCDVPLGSHFSGFTGQGGWPMYVHCFWGWGSPSPFSTRRGHVQQTKIGGDVPTVSRHCFLFHNSLGVSRNVWSRSKKFVCFQAPVTILTYDSQKSPSLWPTAKRKFWRWGCNCSRQVCEIESVFQCVVVFEPIRLAQNSMFLVKWNSRELGLSLTR